MNHVACVEQFLFLTQLFIGKQFSEILFSLLSPDESTLTRSRLKLGGTKILHDPFVEVFVSRDIDKIRNVDRTLDNIWHRMRFTGANLVTAISIWIIACKTDAICIWP